MFVDQYRWCRRIFASVDVAGSTALKQRNPEDSGRWATVFKMFFDEFPTTLRANFEKIEDIADGKPSRALQVWKFVGDEILFVAEIKRHEEVPHHALAFKNTLNGYTDQLKKKPELGALSLKGTMWGAGFPVTNVEVSTTFGEFEKVSDYLGPCVDQGFRLCALADTRRIPVSVDIAYFIAATTFSGKSPLKMQCEEPKAHKGVALPYPHFWLDRQDGAVSEEDKLLERRPLKDPSAFKPYLEELYDQKRPGLFKPFLIDDPNAFFKRIPQALDETRKKLLQTAAEQSYEQTETPPSIAAVVNVPPPRLP